MIRWARPPVEKRSFFRQIGSRFAGDRPAHRHEEFPPKLSASDDLDTHPPMASKTTTSVDVEIFGNVYHVKGEQDRDYLLRLAAIVDRKMNEIGQQVPMVDSGKIAILAALNLADELLQCNDQQEGERVDIMEKVAELTGVLTEALDT